MRPSVLGLSRVGGPVTPEEPGGRCARVHAWLLPSPASEVRINRSSCGQEKARALASRAWWRQSLAQNYRRELALSCWGAV